MTATEDTNAQYVDAEDQGMYMTCDTVNVGMRLLPYSLVNIISKSPAYSIPHSHQGSSHRGSYISEMELSMHQTPKSPRRSASVDILTRTNLVSRSLDETFEAEALRSDSVHTEIIRIPQVLPISEAAAAATSITRSVDNSNSSVNNSVVEHHSNVPSPVSTMHGNDNCHLVSSNPDMPPSSTASETVCQSINNGDFASNEQKLQLYLKQNGLPYRVMRRNVETDLEAGLQIYFELDVLDENNKFICDKCTAERMEKQGIYVCVVCCVCMLCLCVCTRAYVCACVCVLTVSYI